MQSGAPCPPVAHHWPISVRGRVLQERCMVAVASSQVIRSIRNSIFRLLCISSQWFSFSQRLLTFTFSLYSALLFPDFTQERPLFTFVKISSLYFSLRCGIRLCIGIRLWNPVLSAMRNSSLYRNSSLESGPFIICSESLVGFLNIHEPMKPLHVFSINIYMF